MDINERINELLGKKGWTGYELSKQTGISTNTVYDWLKGKSVPSMATLIKICDAFGITLKQFFFGTDAYELNEDEARLLDEWFSLTEFEQNAIKNMIETFRAIRSDK